MPANEEQVKTKYPRRHYGVSPPLGEAIDAAGEATDRKGEGLQRSMLIAYIAANPVKCVDIQVPPAGKAPAESTA